MKQNLKEEKVMEIVKDVIHETFFVDKNDIDKDTVAIDIPGWDSLSHIILLSNIEDAIGKKLFLEEAEFDNVGELVEYIYNYPTK